MKKQTKYILLFLGLLIGNKAAALSSQDYQNLTSPGALIFIAVTITLLAVLLILPSVIETLLKLLSNNKTKLLLLIAGLFSKSASAEILNVSFYQELNWVDFVLCLAVSVFFLAILTQLRVIVRLKNELNGIDELGNKKSSFSILVAKFSSTKSIENESDLLLDHDYDGIKELDNNLPTWWIYSFYLSIIFAVVYMVHFHVLKTGDLMIAEYENELVEAQEQLSEKQASGIIVLVDENNVELISDVVSLNKGALLYKSMCAACHANEAQGLVGPNLTDNYWVHGGEFKEVFSTIKYGVPEKGMIAWKSQLSPTQIQNITSYIFSLKGTNPPNPKAPEGTLME